MAEPADKGAEKKAGNERLELTEELYRRYVPTMGTAGRFRAYARFYYKKYSWIIVVGGAQLLKRAIDICAAAAGLLILLPLFIVVAICIKATDRGSVFFVQRRVGKWGREIAFPKFRSMVANAEQIKNTLREQSHHGAEGVTFKMKNDPRVTWIGRIIRKLSIDELPQLWCVLKGDMSLVGPRPPTIDEVSKYSLADRRRLDMTPGLTCIWQISGRGDIPFPQQVKLDVDYIESQSVRLDLWILLKTIPAVLLGKGAY